MARVEGWKKEKKMRTRDYDEKQYSLAKRVAVYRSKAKRAKEMLFKEEQWYKDLKQIENESYDLVVDAHKAIEELERLIDSLYGQKRILGKFIGRNTPRRFRRPSTSNRNGAAYH